MLPIAYTTPLEPGKLYHIYNDGNNHQDVFTEAGDYMRFLNKWRRYIFPVAKTFAYNLLPNHFHTLVQIRDAPLSSANQISATGEITRPGTPTWVSRAFTNFFISFARTMQNLHGFHGAVFHSPFKRKLLDEDMNFDFLTAYIHYNANKHGLFNGALNECPHSSYLSLISEEPTLLDRDYMLNYFGGIPGFIKFHEKMAGLIVLRDDLEQ